MGQRLRLLLCILLGGAWGCEQTVVGSAARDAATVDARDGADVALDVTTPSSWSDADPSDCIALALCFHSLPLGHVYEVWCNAGQVCCRFEFVLPEGYDDYQGHAPLQCQRPMYCSDGGVYDAGLTYACP